MILGAEPGQQLTIANVDRPLRGFNGIRIARSDFALARRTLGDRPGPDPIPKPPAVSRPVDERIDRPDQPLVVDLCNRFAKDCPGR